MKIKLFLLVNTICCFSFGQVPNYVANQNLSAWYSFSNNANDGSINALNLTNNGGVLSSDRFNNSNSAYSFNGSNSQFQSIPNPANELFDFGTSDFSISCWFKTNSIGTNTVLHKRRMGGASGLVNFEGYTLFVDTGLIVFDLEDLNNNATVLVDSSLYDDGLWHHVVVTRNVFIDSLFMFVDGVKTSSVKDLSVSSISNNSDFLVGRWNNYSYGFNGSIDDLGLWKRALNDCEIRDLYLSQLNSLVSPVTLNGASLFAEISGASYQWLDCDNGNSEIFGATDQTFSPSESYGNYSVQLELNGCIDTSDCYLLDYSGLNSLSIESIGELVRITDLTGKEIPFQKNVTMLMIYSSGTVKRVFEFE